MKSSVEDSAMSNLEAEAWNGNQHGTEGMVGCGVSTPDGTGGGPTTGLVPFGAPAGLNTHYNALACGPEGL